MTTPIVQTTYNPARNNTFEFGITGYKKLSLQCENVPLTGLTLGSAVTNSPYELAFPDNQVSLDPISIDFEVSEDYSEWFDVAEWIYKCSYTPNAQEKYATTAVLSIKDNNYQPVLTVTYIGVQPVGLGQIQYTTTDNGSTELKANFNFRYDTVQLTHIPTNRTFEFHDR